MERPLDTCETVDLWKYIAYLEGCLNGSSELIQALNTASKVFSDDLNKICSGDTSLFQAEGDEDVPVSNLTLLSGDAKDKTFDRIMVLFDKFDKIKALSQHFTDTKPKNSVKLSVAPGGNVFEHVIKSAKQNGSTKS